MNDLLILALWLGYSSFCLFDSLVVTAVMGTGSPPSVRQEWLAAPLVLSIALLLFTPWAAWAGSVLAIALVFHLAGHLVGQHRVEAELQPATPELVERVHSLAERWSTRRPDRVLLDRSDLLGPGVMGLLRSTLILPQGVLSLSEAELEAVIAHELAHVAARDPLKLWLTRFARTLLGWHPAARRLAAGIALEVEMEADRKATLWLGDCDSYVLTLGRWGLRQASPQPSRYGVALMATSSQLVFRLKRLLNPTVPLPYLELPRWLERAGRPTKKLPQRLSRWLHLPLSAGYLALFLFLIRLV